MSNRIIKALEISVEAHKKQKRRFDKGPYIIHPLRVAEHIREFVSQNRVPGFPEKEYDRYVEDLLIISYCHDLVEDTETSIEEIEDLFGPFVRSCVQDLTSDDELAKEKGKVKYLTDKMNSMRLSSLLVKLFDRYDNIHDLHTREERWADKYYFETVEIIRELDLRRFNLEEREFLQKVIDKITECLVKYVGSWNETYRKNKKKKEKGREEHESRT